MEAQQCLVRKNTSVAFLDPELINEQSCKGRGSDPHQMALDLAGIFLECQYKESILLAYECEYVFS